MMKEIKIDETQVLDLASEEIDKFVNKMNVKDRDLVDKLLSHFVLVGVRATLAIISGQMGAKIIDVTNQSNIN